MFKTSMAKVGLVLLVLAIITGSFSAQAQEISPASIKVLQDQINALQKQLEDLKAAQAEAAAKAAQAEAAAKTAAAAPAPSAPSKTALIKPEGRGTLKVGDRVKVTVGGFVEAASIYRSKNEVADVGSNFNTGIPFDLTGSSKKGAENPLAHQSDFRETARQSRVTALVEAKATEQTLISGYLESDFLGAGQTANSNESNSYNPRLRVIYGTIDQSACGLHFLAGQEWSLLTTDKVGIIPRQENIPLTIDAQYVPGFNWTRNPQLRLAKDFDDQKIWLAISAESPQAVLTGIGTPPSFINGTNAGGSLFDKNNNYTSDFAPDIIAKAAFDPGFGHYEIFGITRFYHDYVLAAGAPANAALGNNDAVGFAGGAGVILPVMPKMLDLQANFMAGQGIGRYGSVQLPDLAFTSNGEVKPLTGYSALVGAVAHPCPSWDTYVYAGYEGVNRANYATTVADTTSIGYGDFDLPIGEQQTSDVWQITAGFWDRIYEGNFGKVQIGAQYSFTNREAFTNTVGVAQHANENTFMTSFRFYPM